MKLQDILARRTDLGTFLVHLSRDSAGQNAKDRLKNIILSGSINAVSPFGHAVKRMAQSGLNTDDQKCVCFTETPLEHISLLTAPIEGRQIKFQPYGIVISKKLGREYGVNPVWYLDITPGHYWLTNPLDQMVDEAIRNGQTDPLFWLTPFVEQFGKGKDFSWEREWRTPKAFSCHSATSFCARKEINRNFGLSCSAQVRHQMTYPWLIHHGDWKQLSLD